MKSKPIEIDFPIEQVNEIAEREAHAKEKYRPIYFIHKWWARRLESVFRTIVLYSLLDENAKVLDDDGRWRPVTKEELENPWLLYLKDVDLGGKPKRKHCSVLEDEIYFKVEDELKRKASLSYESLNKALKMRNLGVDKIISAGLVEREGSQLLILTSSERKEMLESRRKENLSIIERVHYLYWLWKNDKFFSFEKTLSEDERALWKNDLVFKALEYLEVESDKTYSDVMKTIKTRW